MVVSLSLCQSLLSRLLKRKLEYVEYVKLMAINYQAHDMSKTVENSVILQEHAVFRLIISVRVFWRGSFVSFRDGSPPHPIKSGPGPPVPPRPARLQPIPREGAGSKP